jgi:hypothetical protein
LISVVAEERREEVHHVLACDTRRRETRLAFPMEAARLGEDEEGECIFGKSASFWQVKKKC